MDNEHYDAEKIKRLREAMYSRSLSKHIKNKPRRELQPLDHDLPTDWNEPEEEVPRSRVAAWGIKGVHFARRATRWMFILAITFFVISLGVFTYFFTFGAGGFVTSPGNVDITVRGPSALAGGESAELQIIIVNRGRSTLELADLVITYPPGTRSSSDFLTELPRQRISLGSIEPGGERRGNVSAVFIGTEGGVENVLVELEYRVARSSAVFVADTNYELRFRSSPVAIAIEANDEAISGQHLALTATISSNVDTILRDVIVEAEFPFGFTFESAHPAPANNATWEIGDLRPGDEYLIELRGILEGQEADERVFRMIAGTRQEQENQGIDLRLTEGTHRVAIARPFLGVSINVSEEGTQARALEPGSVINVSINWVNNLSTPIADAVLVAEIDGLAIGGERINVVDGFYRSADRSILWDSVTTRGDFSQLAPGETGTARFTFTVPDEQDLLFARNESLSITVNAAGRRIGDVGAPETLRSSTSRTLSLLSNMQFVAQGFYHANPFESTGPLPPKANTETTYAIVWSVANTANQVTDATLTAQLPPYVRWIGEYSPGSENLHFNRENGTITWELGSVSPNVGITGGLPPRQVAFSIGFTPSESQVGEVPPLILDQSLQGYDTFAEQEITQRQPNITTNLVDDPGFSSGQAEVER